MAKTARMNKDKAGAAGLGVTSLDKLVRDASEVGMGVIMVLAALIGIWGLACLIGGIANGGGAAELWNGYIAAVTGH